MLYNDLTFVLITVKKFNLDCTGHPLLCLLQDRDKYQFGKSKIFFRAGQVAYLEKLRSERLRYCGVLIQKHVRGWLARIHYQRIRRTVLLCQTFGRGLLARRYSM